MPESTPDHEVEEVLAAIRRLIVEGPARRAVAAPASEPFLLSPSMRIGGGTAAPASEGTSQAGPQPPAGTDSPMFGDLASLLNAPQAAGPAVAIPPLEPLEPLLLRDLPPFDNPKASDAASPAGPDTPDAEPIILHAEPEPLLLSDAIPVASTVPEVQPSADAPPDPLEPLILGPSALLLEPLLLRAEAPAADEAPSGPGPLILTDPLPLADEPQPLLILHPNSPDDEPGLAQRDDAEAPNEADGGPELLPEDDGSLSPEHAVVPLLATDETPGVSSEAGPVSDHPSGLWPEPSHAADLLVAAPAAMLLPGMAEPAADFAGPGADGTPTEPLPSLRVPWEDHAQDRPHDSTVPWEDPAIESGWPASDQSEAPSMAVAADEPGPEPQDPAQDAAVSLSDGTEPDAAPPADAEEEPQAMADLSDDRVGSSTDETEAPFDSAALPRDASDAAVFAAIRAGTAVPVRGSARLERNAQFEPPLDEAELRALVADLVRVQVLRELPALRDSLRQEVMEALRNAPLPSKGRI